MDIVTGVKTLLAVLILIASIDGSFSHFAVLRHFQVQPAYKGRVGIFLIIACFAGFYGSSTYLMETLLGIEINSSVVLLTLLVSAFSAIGLLLLGVFCRRF